MRAVPVLATLAGALAGTATLVEPARGPRFAWNASHSAPVGLYRVYPGIAITRGDLVLARTPDGVRRLAAERHYLPANVPLVKRVAALNGDAVCTLDDAIFVNGVAVTQRLRHDHEGRPLPRWQGCRVLDGEFFLLMRDVPDSFDGRYFGPVPASAIIGRLAPLWTK